MAAVANGFLHNPPSGRSSTSSSPTSPSFHSAHAAIQRLVPGRPSTPASGAQVAGTVQLEPPPGLSYLDFVRQWSDAHVALWLQGCKCGHQADIFSENDIRGDVVLDLDHATLKEMGIVSVGERARIVNAVKQLRTKCHASKLITPGPPRVTLTNSNQAPAQDVVFPEAGLARSNSKRGAGGARPPPLTLKPSARSDVELVRTSGNTPRPAVSTPSTANHTPVQTSRPFLPPLPPVPRTNPPPPPSSNRSTSSQTQQQRPSNLGLPSQPAPGRARTPTPEPGPPPAYTTQPLPPAPTPTPATPSHGWSRDGGYGLPPNPGAYRTSSPHQASSQPRPSQQQRPAGAPGHQKTSSLSRSAAAAGHPYAMPTLEPPSFKANDLSPIAESFMSPSGRTPSTLAPPSSVLGRPTTPLNQSNPGIDELRRKTLKVYLEDGGSNNYRIINVHDCERGIDVLERVLKKFTKYLDGDQDITTEGGLVLDGYGAFYDDSISDGKPLTDTQLLYVTHADPDSPERELGLRLRLVQQQRYDRYAGEHLRTSSSQTSLQTSAEIKKMNRASSISILSSLGVPNPERTLLSADTSASPTRSPGSPTRTNKPGKLRNFFGQRPPSELITTHLAEFFPYTEPKVLERTHRHSMLRQSTISSKRDSRFRRDSSSTTWLPPPSSRFSTSTLGSRSRASMETMPRGSSPPPLPEKPSPAHSPDAGYGSPSRMSFRTGDGEMVDVKVEEVADEPSSQQLLPPVPISEPLAFPSLDRRASTASRMSYLSELRAKRDTSDTASMLTVDEITQEVESRRASWIGQSSSAGEETEEEDDEEEEEEAASEEATLLDEAVAGPSGGASFRRKPSVGLTGGAKPPAPPALQVDDEDDDEDEDEDDDDEEETVEGGEMSAAPGQNIAKWIRGALIGSGSFGSVYLGMNKFTGMLMAVKQVELPSGSSHNEERKKSMLTALEREIDLLKDLQHENIVQYLDSSMDDQYLNIFLEYVPGGSVAALLNNYGAFEEALVRNFVRQILQGLNYLHEREIIHRDIKGANILVDNKGGIKISDFGISKKVADNILKNSNRPSLQGSVFWMAPEVVKQTSYTRKADIWSLGCLVVEMFTGQHPYPKLNQMQAIFKIGQSAKPATPDDISSDAEDFLNQTFEIDYQARPSAAELLTHSWIINDPANPAGKKAAKDAST
ncbi:Pkinase-domain-containing protein [Exidia glandulosa HHB12029]|uniref:Pkinase-domain-containing protein n=1 Tax=Exidia glandulosa HHB12029 TaxID=1314781 RepID=A0A165GAL8_EXIGL|nr:Pkinase-domain-containing protein [Exidia glandulosa HHB12029]